MDLRCPTSDYLGVARLNGYKWIINDRGYANVVEVKDPKTKYSNSDNEKYENVVFGLIYSLQPDDEAMLDKNEGVPIAYTKEHLVCEFWPSKDGNPVDVEHDVSTEKKMLIYINRNRTTESKPKTEYIVRMNNGIKDAIKMGVPEAYVKAVMRRFIPAPETCSDGLGDEEKAMRQAVTFVDEN
jgi:gamma-glutamylcyclotransferase